jgi:steroid delta-isomerase-like uncharacterized protein
MEMHMGKIKIGNLIYNTITSKKKIISMAEVKCEPSLDIHEDFLNAADEMSAVFLFTTRGGISMSPEENMRIVRRIYAEVFDRHNLDVIDEFYTPDFIYHSPGNPDFDRERLKQGLGAYITAFPDVRLTVEDIFAAGDRVAVRFSAIGTQRGEYLGVPPTGKQITVTSILIHRLSDGKMVEDWEWEDHLGVLQQLGIVSLPQDAA